MNILIEVLPPIDHRCAVCVGCVLSGLQSISIRKENGEILWKPSIEMWLKYFSIFESFIRFASFIGKNRPFLFQAFMYVNFCDITENKFCVESIF